MKKNTVMNTAKTMITIWGTYLFEGKERQAHTRNKLLAQRSRYARVDKGIAVACVTFFGLTTVVSKIATILYSRCSEKIFLPVSFTTSESTVAWVHYRKQYVFIRRWCIFICKRLKFLLQYYIIKVFAKPNKKF